MKRILNDTESHDPAVKRIQMVEKLLESNKPFKVLSDAASDHIPLMAQYRIDMVGWIELNRLAKELDLKEFTCLGPNGT